VTNVSKPSDKAISAGDRMTALASMRLAIFIKMAGEEGEMVRGILAHTLPLFLSFSILGLISKSTHANEGFIYNHVSCVRY
jgi:hypothetical protein